MKNTKLAAHSIFLAMGMFLYSCVAVGAYQKLFFVASTLWITVLIVLGFFIRRRIWIKSIDVTKIVGLGLLGFFAILLMIGLFQDQNIVDMLRNSGQIMASYYIVWFWFPFIIGAALGGIHSKIIQAEQAAPRNR